MLNQFKGKGYGAMCLMASMILFGLIGEVETTSVFVARAILILFHAGIAFILLTMSHSFLLDILAVAGFALCVNQVLGFVPVIPVVFPIKLSFF